MPLPLWKNDDLPSIVPQTAAANDNHMSAWTGFPGNSTWYYFNNCKIFPAGRERVPIRTASACERKCHARACVRDAMTASCPNGRIPAVLYFHYAVYGKYSSKAGSHILILPRRLLDNVSLSAYSRSPPTGRPEASRLISGDWEKSFSLRNFCM